MLAVPAVCLADAHMIGRAHDQDRPAKPQISESRFKACFTVRKSLLVVSACRTLMIC